MTEVLETTKLPAMRTARGDLKRSKWARNKTNEDEEVRMEYGLSSMVAMRTPWSIELSWVLQEPG